MYNAFAGSFEWDEEKSEWNRQRRGFGFDEARFVWDDTYAEEFVDTSHSEDEPRYAKLGDAGSRLLWVVFTVVNEREGRYRIISARKATRSERQYYEEKRKAQENP